MLLGPPLRHFYSHKLVRGFPPQKNPNIWFGFPCCFCCVAIEYSQECGLYDSLLFNTNCFVAYCDLWVKVSCVLEGMCLLHVSLWPSLLIVSFRSTSLLTVRLSQLSVTEREVSKSSYDYAIVHSSLKFYQLLPRLTWFMF